MTGTAGLLRTPLYEVHRREGARIVEFAGWEMPVEYTGIRQEHQATRTGTGLFDLSHMGEIEVTGPGATAYLNYMVTNDVERLEPGQCLYTCMCGADGGILDDLLVYRFPDMQGGERRFWLVVNASNRLKVVEWMENHLSGDAQLNDLSLDTALLAVQGPEAQEFLQPGTEANLEELGYYHLLETKVAGIPAVLSRTGYTGEDGFELYVAWERVEELWNSLRQVGGIVPVGLGARDTLRLEAGYSLYGHEISELTTPLDAGLGWVVRWSKPDFLGKAALSRQKEKGARTTIVGLEMLGRGIPRQGYPVEGPEGPVGVVTSGTFSPSLSKGIALARVDIGCRAEGTELSVIVRGRSEPARVVRPPFVRGSVRRG
ncbi:MAG: glycine cleavage system aminomethyltransferase GcvT [Candidatus Xenobium sp.]|nr:glycine cleavage system aminomethyltransferase GcvT [Burkholderiales bacterium]